MDKKKDRDFKLSLQTYAKETPSKHGVTHILYTEKHYQKQKQSFAHGTRRVGECKNVHFLCAVSVFVAVVYIFVVHYSLSPIKNLGVTY